MATAHNVLDAAVQEAVVELDRALDAVQEKFQRCVRYVDEGKLHGNVLMVKLIEFQSRLTAGGQ